MVEKMEKHDRDGGKRPETIEKWKSSLQLNGSSLSAIHANRIAARQPDNRGKNIGGSVTGFQPRFGKYGPDFASSQIPRLLRRSEFVGPGEC
jgi:hypothetical protein